jgi:putative flavoprotein involved in K+ transport
VPELDVNGLRFHVQVLGSCGLRCIKDEDRDVAAVDGPHRPQHAVLLDAPFDGTAPADADPDRYEKSHVFCDVLVVGGGNTGYQIAKELSATHRVYLAVGSRQTPLPQRFLGRDLFWWLTKTHLIRTTVESLLGRRMRERDTLIGSSPRRLTRRYGVELKPRVVDASGRTVRFADGSELEVDAVIIDNEDGARLAVEHLIAHGHRRIAHIAGPQEVYPLELRRATYEHVMRQAGHAESVRVVVAASTQREAGAEAMATLLADEERPTAVFVASDGLAIGAIVARTYDLTPGEDGVRFYHFAQVAIDKAYTAAASGRASRASRSVMTLRALAIRC